uniref:HTH psq-type domain-containing protein n=1 Tax=Timema tahoe TaxID=61484 RepID=A0A7R9IHU5_9NEOP|nr:unnamed protein product [Timema tahoe]
MVGRSHMTNEVIINKSEMTISLTSAHNVVRMTMGGRGTHAIGQLAPFPNEESIAQALEDLKSGRTLVETAIAHNVPRSTLYVRARTQHVSLAYTRQEHSGEIIKAAVQAVVDGASLQKASEKHKIPKTVLWRRVQKELGRYGISHRRGAGTRTPSRSEKRLAAIQALEQGDTLTTVSKQFQPKIQNQAVKLKQVLEHSCFRQIPKTTLFREKTRLVEAGRLPWSCLRKRDPEYDGKHQRRLKDAVTACMEGKMSQATASMTYQVPKTTIWRRLHKGSVKGSQESREGEEVDDPESKPAEGDETEDQPEYTLDLTNQVLESDEFGETSLIILSTRGSGEEIDLQEGNTIIVSTGTRIGKLFPHNKAWGRDLRQVAGSPRKRQQALMTTRWTLLKSREKKQSLDILVCSAVSQTEVPAPDVSSVKHSEKRVAE